MKINIEKGMQEKYIKRRAIAEFILSEIVIMTYIGLFAWWFVR